MELPRSILHTLSARPVFQTVCIAILAFAILPLSAVAATSQLVCSPARLGFGTTVVGQAETLPVTLTNNGQSTATVTAVSVSNSEFAYSSLNLPLVLAAGQSANLSVTFTPTQTGWTGGAIRFTGDTQNGMLQVGGVGVNSQGLIPAPSSLSFGQVAVGSTSTLPIVLTNARNWKLTLSSIQTSGAGFSAGGPTFPLTLGVGQSVTVNVAFAPQSPGASAGTLFVAGAGLVVPLAGTGASPGQLIGNPGSLSFGNVQVGGSASLMDSLTNSGTSSVTITQATATGAGFSVTGLNPPLTLNPGQSVSFTATFAPQSAGSSTGTINVVSNATDENFNVALSGTGMAQGQLIPSPPTVNFGNVTVGTSSSQTASLSASGSSVTVSSASVSNPEFSLTGISFPVTIPAGQSVPITLTFTPQSSGAASAALSYVSSAGNAASQTLTGVGVAVQQHTVSLSWNDSGSGIAGYNVYRGANTGGPYAQINSALETATAYTDSSVQSGQTYYYVTTAVDQNGVESSYSNEAEGVIPTP